MCLRLFKVIALLKDTSAGQVVSIESWSNSSFIHSKNSKAAACCFTLIRPYKTNIPQKNPGWERNEKTRPAWNKPKTLYALINSRWLTLTLTSWEAKERARESVERISLMSVKRISWCGNRGVERVQRITETERTKAQLLFHCLREKSWLGRASLGAQRLGHLPAMHPRSSNRIDFMSKWKLKKKQTLCLPKATRKPHHSENLTR